MKKQPKMSIEVVEEKTMMPPMKAKKKASKLKKKKPDPSRASRRLSGLGVEVTAEVHSGAGAGSKDDLESISTDINQDDVTKSPGRGSTKKVTLEKKMVSLQLGVDTALGSGQVDFKYTSEKQEEQVLKYHKAKNQLSKEKLSGQPGNPRLPPVPYVTSSPAPSTEQDAIIPTEDCMPYELHQLQFSLLLSQNQFHHGLSTPDSGNTRLLDISIAMTQDVFGLVEDYDQGLTSVLQQFPKGDLSPQLLTPTKIQGANSILLKIRVGILQVAVDYAAVFGSEVQLRDDGVLLVGSPRLVEDVGFSLFVQSWMVALNFLLHLLHPLRLPKSFHIPKEVELSVPQSLPESNMSGYLETLAKGLGDEVVVNKTQFCHSKVSKERLSSSEGSTDPNSSARDESTDSSDSDPNQVETGTHMYHISNKLQFLFPGDLASQFGRINLRGSSLPQTRPVKPDEWMSKDKVYPL